MTGLTIGLALAAAVLHATWNAVLKTSGERVPTMAVIMGTGAMVGVVMIAFVRLPAPQAWPYLFASMVFHSAYYFFLIKAYHIGDFSQVYPMARGTAPLLVALASGPLIGEPLGVMEWGGICAITLGLISLSHRPPGAAAGPVVYALITGTFIGAYSLADGMGVRASGHWLSYIAWMNMLDALPLLLFVLFTRFQTFRTFVGTRAFAHAALGGGIATLAYGLVVFAYSIGVIAPVSAVRETSVILAAAIGATLMRESFGLRRVFAATTVAAGVALLSFGGP